MNEQIFLTKQDLSEGFKKGKYKHISTQAQEGINECKKDSDVLLMEVKTGSGLQVESAEKLRYDTFIELCRASQSKHLNSKTTSTD